MADFTVTTLDDELDTNATVAAPGGNGLSLREALALANGNGSAQEDTITFATGGTIFLSQDQDLLITTSLIAIDGDIDHDGAPDITIDADSGPGLDDAVSRVFIIGTSASTTVSAVLNGLVIRDGHADTIGGIYVGRSDALTLSNSTVTGNSTGPEGHGGGILASANAALTLVNTTVSDNSAGRRGGGIFAQFDSTITLTNATVSGNSTGDGGAAIYGFRNVSITLTNATVTGNSAGLDGGGIMMLGENGVTTLANSIVAGNAADFRGDDLIANQGTFVFVGGNVVGSAPALLGPASTNGSYTRIDGTNRAALETVFADVALVDPDGAGAVHALFYAGVLADNGGPVQTVALNPVAANPAINSGDATRLNEATVNRDLNGDGDKTDTITTDARGLARAVGAGPDLGAFEAQNLAPAFTGALADGSEVVSVTENTATATNTPNGTTIIDVNAVDGNGGAADAGLSYAITAGNTDRDGDSVLPFAIDAAGVITVNDAGDLDHEVGPSFALTVLADDGASESNTATATVTVSLTDQAETFTVTMLADQAYDNGTLAAEQQDGGGLSLREALALANAGASSADTITFAPALTGGTTAGVDNGTIALGLGQLVVASDITIDGDVTGDDIADITIDANDASRVFHITAGTSTLDALVITGGREPAQATGRGGGVYIGSAAEVTITHAEIVGNYARRGGGLYNSGHLTLADSMVVDNGGRYGGGIRNNGTLMVHRAVLAGNDVRGGQGGGLQNLSGAAAVVTDSTVASNLSHYAGGIGNYGDLTLVNTTLGGNFASAGSGGAGGIRNHTDASASLINVTISGNNSTGSTGGGGIRNDGTLTLTNSIVAGNDATTPEFDNINGAVTLRGGNIVGDTFTVDGDSPQSGIALADVFATVVTHIPPFGPAFQAGELADNGGPVQTVALRLETGNPALDSGNATLLSEATLNKDLNGNGDTADTITTDARGFARAIGAGPDLGAFEIQNTAPSEAANEGLTVNEGESAAITDGLLDFDDAQQGDGAIIYTITSATTNGMLSLNGTPLGGGRTFTQADVGSGALTYEHDGSETSTDSFGFDVSDGVGGTGTGQTFAFTIDPIADRAGGAAGGTIQYFEDDLPAALDPSLTVTDPDSTDLVGARIAITGNFAVGQDVLGFTPQSGITGTYDAETGVLTLTGTATLAQYEDALRSVTYFNGSQNPSDAARTVSFQIDDGGGLVSLGNVGVTVIPQLDPPGDLNGDHTTDVVWRNGGGTVVLWEMAGVDVVGNHAVGTLPDYWHIVDADGDFDGDGASDILWRDDAGAVVLWTMDGPDILSNTAVAGPIPHYWHIQDTGDFTGDGRADILWRDDAGRVVLWEMDGADIVSNQLVADVATSSQIADTADFSGDGTNDILWRDQGGTLRIWEMDGATVESDAPLGTVADTRHLAGTGDFNRDERFDILWRDDDGTVTLWEMDGAAIIGDTALGILPDYWRIADLGDYTGDMRSDILWRDDTGTIVLWAMDGPTTLDNTAVNTIPTNWNIVA